MPCVFLPFFMPERALKKKVRPFFNEASRNFNEASQNLKKVLAFFQHLFKAFFRKGSAFFDNKPKKFQTFSFFMYLCFAPRWILGYLILPVCI